MAEQVNVVAELLKVFKLPPEPGEAKQEYAKRLALKANDKSSLSDRDWNALTEDTQNWVNAALEAIESKELIKLPDGIEAVFAERDKAASEDPEKGASQQGAPEKEKDAASGKSSSAGKSGGGKKATPAKKGGGKPPAKKPAAEAPPKKAAKAPSKAAPAKGNKSKSAAGGATSRGPRGSFSSSDVITKLVDVNPYRAATKSYDWFAKYKNGMTVAAAVAAGVPRHHIRWDKTQGNVKIAPADKKK